MKINYTNTFEDHIAFVKNHSSISKQSKKIVIWFSVLSILIIMFWKISNFINTRDILYLIEGFVFSIISIFVFIFAYKKSLISLSQKNYNNKDNEGFYCEHEIIVDELGITDLTDYGTQFTKWLAIAKIEETDEYLYIYIDSISAHVIPKKRIKGSFTEFNKLLKQGATQCR